MQQLNDFYNNGLNKQVSKRAIVIQKRAYLKRNKGDIKRKMIIKKNQRSQYKK